MPAVADAGEARGPVSPRPTRLPYYLLGLLFAGLAVFVALGYRDHGRTFDEFMQDDYGYRSLQWYLTFGQDRSFMDMGEQIHMPEHGPVYETFVAAIQHLTGETWNTRSVVGGIVGVLGIALIALCGREVAGPWGAFTAATGLALYPRYTGAIFTNSKDVPFTVAMIATLWLVLRMMRRWDEHNRRFEIVDYALVGAAIGISAAIRVNGLVWLGLLGLLALFYWVRHHSALRTWSAIRAELATQFGAALVIVSSCYLFMTLSWPFLLVRPATGLRDSILMMAKYDWNNTVLFNGEQVLATQLPWSYAPVWLLIASPLPVVVLTLIAAGIGIWAFRRNVQIPATYLMCAAYAVIPLAMIIFMQATLYNGIRQYLYIVPGFILIASGLLVTTLRRLHTSGRRTLAGALVAVTVLGQAEAVVSSAEIYPYEYAYFNPLVGGYAEARHKYESDYWHSCATAAARWLNAHYREYYTTDPTFQDEVNWNTLTEPELPGFTAVGDGSAIYVLSEKPKEGFQEIHAVMVAGEPLCRVLIRDGYR
jgi:Dolichyl-phosphate-mannose-protein mannosyltransferase